MLIYFGISFILSKESLCQINKQRSILLNTQNVFKTPLTLFTTQMIYPFLNSRISANHDKGQGFQPIVKSLQYPLMFLQCRISFILSELDRERVDVKMYKSGVYCRMYNRRKYCWYPVKMVAVAILGFSLLLPIQLSLFQICDGKSCRS